MYPFTFLMYHTQNRGLEMSWWNALLLTLLLDSSTTYEAVVPWLPQKWGQLPLNMDFAEGTPQMAHLEPTAAHPLQPCSSNVCWLFWVLLMHVTWGSWLSHCPGNCQLLSRQNVLNNIFSDYGSALDPKHRTILFALLWGVGNINIPVTWERHTEPCVDSTRQQGRQSFGNMRKLKEKLWYHCTAEKSCPPSLVSRGWEWLDSRTHPKTGLPNCQCSWESSQPASSSIPMDASWELFNKILLDHRFKV